MSIAADWARVIVTGLPGRGVPPHICAMFEPPVATPAIAADAPIPGGCMQLIVQLLPTLLPLLIGCIPAAKTKEGLLAAMKRMNQRILGFGMRVRLGQAIYDAIVARAGTDQDGQELLNALLTPLKNGIIDQCMTVTTPEQAQAIIDEASPA